MCVIKRYIVLLYTYTLHSTKQHHNSDRWEKRPANYGPHSCRQKKTHKSQLSMLMTIATIAWKIFYQIRIECTSITWKILLTFFKKKNWLFMLCFIFIPLECWILSTSFVCVSFSFKHTCRPHRSNDNLPTQPNSQGFGSSKHTHTHMHHGMHTKLTK